MAGDRHFELNATHRLIPAHFAEGSVLESLPLPKPVLTDLGELDAATNERKFAEHSGNSAIGIGELLMGVPEAMIVNAAFCHPGPHGARFSDHRRGAWYAGVELGTSVAEVAAHKRRFLKEAHIEAELKFVYQDFLADFYGIFSELDSEEQKDCLQPEPVPACYGAGQALALKLLYAGKNGIVYPSVRDQPDGVCIACFRPAMVYRPRRGGRYQLTMDAGSSEQLGIEAIS
jgi:hypothetical protein